MWYRKPAVKRLSLKGLAMLGKIQRHVEMHPVVDDTDNTHHSRCRPQYLHGILKKYHRRVKTTHRCLRDQGRRFPKQTLYDKMKQERAEHRGTPISLIGCSIEAGTCAVLDQR